MTTIHRSTYFPDAFFTGNRLAPDPAINLMLRGLNTLCKAPAQITLGDMRRFDIDGNAIEEIAFTADREAGLLLYDHLEQQLYLLTGLAKTAILDGTEPDIVSRDRLNFTENGVDFWYDDFSGLIEVEVKNANGEPLYQRLLRLYRRELALDACEYLFACINGTAKQTEYYVGLEININQLK